MYDDGIDNEFELAHQRGLNRGFDLGWSYKGRFDRAILLDYIETLDETKDKDKIKILHTKQIIDLLTSHDNNREFIT
jgi:hypothetical protein